MKLEKATVIKVIVLMMVVAFVIKLANIGGNYELMLFGFIFVVAVAILVIQSQRTAPTSGESIDRADF